MECHYILPTDLPSSTKLYKAFFTDYPRVAEYYYHPPTWEAITRATREVQLGDSTRRAVVEILRKQNTAFGADHSTSASVDRLRDGAVAVVTGQQVGLFGGPAFSIYKALTAIRVAAELISKGINAVPVFWLATEDHDLAEVNHCYFGTRGGFERFDIDASSAEGRRVGDIRLGPSVSELSARAANCVVGPQAEEIGRWISSSYSPEETFGTAFAKLMARIFAGRGLILLDPMSTEIHRLAAPAMRRAIAEHEVITQELVARSTALEKAGLHAQVKVTERSTLLFRILDGQRTAIRSKNGGLIAGTKEDSLEQTLSAFDKHPEEFSPSALLRPVVQDSLLPTVAYVGGPAEVAYHAQVSVLYKRLLGRGPVILPRAGFTLVPGHVRNLLKKYNLEFSDVFAGQQALRSKLESGVLPKSLTQLFEAGEKAVNDVVQSLREPLATLDQTLSGALDTVAEKMLYQFNGLRGKAGRAEGFRIGVLDTHEREITSALIPNGELQERSLSALPFLASEGVELLDHLLEHIHIGTGDHCVLYL